MENFMSINAELRSETGKKISKQLRNKGRIPAIIYGDHKESFPVSLSITDLKTVMKSEKGENTVLKIKRENIEVFAMLKEVQWDYLSDNIIHADLLRIDLNKPVFVSIPVHVNGDPVGVKVEGGIFDFMTREIKVKCLPGDIPVEFAVDISQLHTGMFIKASDLDVDERISILSDPKTVICGVMAKGSADDIEEGEEGEEEIEGTEEAATETA